MGLYVLMADGYRFEICFQHYNGLRVIYKILGCYTNIWLNPTLVNFVFYYYAKDFLWTKILFKMIFIYDLSIKKSKKSTHQNYYSEKMFKILFIASLKCEKP